jgi:capsular exopolysaccharide synthesis family protein
MSRIHEALKKAELERAAGRAVDVAKSPLAPQHAAASEAPQVPPVQNDIDARQANAAPQVVSFRFEDLHSQNRAHPGWQPDPNTDVFAAGLGGYGAEQFRTLRSRLYQLRGSQPLRTILITSSVAGEGKTFVTGNLARAIVRQSERRALVLDADLRRPRLHKVFGTPAAPGLTDYLRGNASEAAVIQQEPGSNLCFIPSGNHVTDPSELLSNGRLKTLLERVAPAFDWIFLDSPPCVPVADAGVIANWCDGVLLIVRANSTPSAVVVKARQELQGRNIAGVVLNAVKNSALAYGSYYASGYPSIGVQASSK